MGGGEDENGENSSEVVQSTRIVWDDTFADVYINNLCVCLGEENISADLSENEFDIDVVTEISFCLVGAANFLQKCL